MSKVETIAGPEFGPLSGGVVRQLVVLLHGWGADGDDLIGLAPLWAQLLPDAVFVSPHAPFACDMGFGRQWFSLDDRRPEVLLAGVRAAAPAIDAFIDETLKRFNLTDGQFALASFSQGTMMSLYVGPRRPAACAGILGFSGALIGGDFLAAETSARPPVMLIHGADDEIVNASALEHASKGLEAADFKVETHLRPGLGHAIDEQGLALGGRFMMEGFGVTAPA